MMVNEKQATRRAGRRAEQRYFLKLKTDTGTVTPTNPCQSSNATIVGSSVTVGTSSTKTSTFRRRKDLQPDRQTSRQHDVVLVSARQDLQYPPAATYRLTHVVSGCRSRKR